MTFIDFASFSGARMRVLVLTLGILLSAETMPGLRAQTPLDGALQAKAEQGDAGAQVQLGLRYIDGTGFPQDEAKAAEWFRRAALQGNAQGQLELGVMYVNGEGIPVDLPEGYAWYSLAARQGNTDAQGYLEDLDRSLSATDGARARKRADELAQLIAAGRDSKPQHRQAEAEKVTLKPPVNANEVANLPPDRKASQGKAVEGKDYTIWQRARIRDENGFAEPIEAYSILLPKGWRTEGGVRWVVNAQCPADAVQNRLTATSPDSRFRLEVFPQNNWQWFDDPMMLQNAAANAQSGFGGCPLARPFDAAQFLEQVLVPNELRGATLLSHQANAEMSALMGEHARQNNAAFQAAGVQVQSRPSAEIGRLQWADGRIGIVLCAVEQTVAMMPNLLNGGTYASYQCRATVKTVLSAPASSETEAGRILATIVASTRINPTWQAAVQKVYGNIARVEQQENAKRAAIWRQSQQEIGDLQRRTWEEGQASRDRISEGWGQVLRGVETWSAPDGGRIELSAGYNEAWSKPDGTYLLSNDPLFDPNVAFQENWKRLEKQK